jgi:hypothetical protein
MLSLPQALYWMLHREVGSSLERMSVLAVGLSFKFMVVI